MKKIIALTLAASAATTMAATSFAFVGGNTKPEDTLPGTSRPGNIDNAGAYALEFANLSGTGSYDKGTTINTMSESRKIELTTVLANGYTSVDQILNDGISFHFNLLKNENNAIANIQLKSRNVTTGARTPGVEFYVEAETRNTFKASSGYEVELILVNNKTGANTKTKFKGVVEYNKQNVNYNGNNMVFNAIPVYDFGSNYVNTTNKVNFTFDSANGSYNFVNLDVVPAHDFGKKFMGFTQEIPANFVSKFDSSYRMQGFRLLDDSLTFGLGATLTFDAAKLNSTEAYLYELATDGTLREIGRTTTGKIIVNEYSRVGGKQYILSNKVLGAATTTPETTPPATSTPSTGDTGTKPPANTGASSDVVNAAVAMSVVALAAAGAVAFKKASK